MKTSGLAARLTETARGRTSRVIPSRPPDGNRGRKRAEKGVRHLLFAQVVLGGQIEKYAMLEYPRHRASYDDTGRFRPSAQIVIATGSRARVDSSRLTTHLESTTRWGADRMSRIGSSGLVGVDRTILNSLLRAQNKQSEAGLRLATMQRINNGSDDPAGLIATETMRAELVAIDAAERNAGRAAAAVKLADSGLSQISSLLNTVRAAVLDSSSNMISDAERAANQIEIDAALEAIDRVVNTTSLGGVDLLQGGDVTFLFSPDPANTTSLTLPDVSTESLGDESGTLSQLASGGTASLDRGSLDHDSLAGAIEILDAASSQVLEARAELGAFDKFTIDSSRVIAQSAETNLTAAISQIFDADIAVETANFIKAQILSSATVASLRITSERRSLVHDLLAAI